jgi:hypothetical protein
MTVRLWIALGPARYYLVPDSYQFTSGPYLLRSIVGQEQHAELKTLNDYEITEDQARRIAKDQLGDTLDELKHGIDEKLEDFRRQIDESNRTPITEDTTVTPNAAPALFDLLKKLPGVIGNSLSGEENRVDAAKAAMADLQRRLKDAGIDLDEHFTDFPDRLAGLRKDFGEQTAANKPTRNEEPSEKK